MQAYQTVFYTLHLPHTGYHDKQVKIAFFSDLHGCCSAEEKAEILKELRYIARRAKISGIWMDELITVLDSSYNE